MRAKTRERVIREYLLNLREYTQARIDAGDLDFDDWVYRTRDAAKTLIEIGGYENGREE